MTVVLRTLATLILASPLAYIGLHLAPALGLDLWTARGGEVLLLVPVVLGALAGVAALALAFTRHRARAKPLAGLMVLGLAVVVPSVYAAHQGRLYAFGRVAARAEPIVQAVRRHVDEQHRPPETVEALVPRYLERLPGGVPPLELRAGPAAAAYCDGNAWVLKADVGSGLLNWDAFVYLEAQNYDHCDRLRPHRRLGAWAYVFE